MAFSHPIHAAIILGLMWASAPARAQSDADPDEPSTETSSAAASTVSPTSNPPAGGASAADRAPAGDAVGAVEVTPPPEQGPSSPADAALSWSALGGTQRPGDGIVAVAFGFSGLPAASYHYGLTDTVSLGVAGGLDFARAIPNFAFVAGGHVAGSLKVSLPLDGDTRLGLRGDLGVWVPSRPGIGLTVDLSANLMAPVAEDLLAGVGVDVPLTIGIVDGETNLTWPLLFGGVAEYRVLAPLSIFAEAKLGPGFVAPGGVYFAMRLLGGVAYRL
jgi:hypothetical protein